MNPLYSRLLRHLMSDTFDDNNRILNALLYRGFLVFSNARGIFLGSGSPEADLRQLAEITALVITATHEEPEAIARISVNAGMVRQATQEILLIGSDVPSGFSTVGVAPHIDDSWVRYQSMQWGAKIPVCDNNSGSLDPGVALLVKVFPLIQVATAYSCDGHGTEPAFIEFHFPWDAPWARGIFKKLNLKTHAHWEWGASRVSISVPVGAYSDLALVEDTQRLARTLMDAKTMHAIRQVRHDVLFELSTQQGESPDCERFEQCLREHLSRCRLPPQ